MKTIPKESSDVTDSLEQESSWRITRFGKPMVELLLAQRFDYELKLYPDGIRVVRKDPDEGKVG